MSNLLKKQVLSTLAVAALLLSSSAHAKSPTTIEAPTLRLSVTVQEKAAQDFLSMTLFVEEDALQAAQANAAAVKAVNAAQAKAREFPTVSFKLEQLSVDRYYANGQIQKGWRARASIQIESTDMASVSSLAAALGDKFQSQGVSYGLSAKTRKALQDSLVAKAAAQFQSDALTTAKALGYSGFSIKEVMLNRSEQSVMPRAFGMVASMAKGGPELQAQGESETAVTLEGVVSLDGH